MEKTAYRNLRKALKKLNYRKVKCLARRFDNHSVPQNKSTSLKEVILRGQADRIINNYLIAENIGLRFKVSDDMSRQEVFDKIISQNNEI